LKFNQANNLIEPVGMRTQCIAGWHRTRRHCPCRPLLSVTYANDVLATALPLSVVSLAAPKLFVATETTRNRENSGRLEWLPLDRVSSVL